MSALIGPAILVGLVVLWWRRRRFKKLLAGQNVEKPTFMVTPPIRTLIGRDEHRW